MSEHQPSPSDFNRNANALTELIRAATSYSRMMATPEETDAMLDRAYGKGRHPGYEGRRWDRARLVCERCGAERPSKNSRFCSWACYAEWERELHRPDPQTPAELVEEMQEALDELRRFIEEGEE